MRTPEDWRRWTRRMARLDDRNGSGTVTLWPCRCGTTWCDQPDQTLDCCDEDQP